MSLASDADPAPPLPIENAPLIGLGEWIGTRPGWQPGAVGQVVVTLAPDAAALEAKKDDALALYRRIESQLAEASDLQIALATSLDSVSTPLPDAAAPQALAAYVRAVVGYLGDAGPLPLPLTLAYSIRQLAPGVPPIPASVSVTLSRQAIAASSTASVGQIATPIPADARGGLRTFAKRFRETFPALRLAVEGRRFDPENPWAFNAQLVEPTIAADPTCFAPAPIAARPQSGVASVPDFGDFAQGDGWPQTTVTFADVDCDRLLASCFWAIDGFNAEPFALAAARAEPKSARAIAAARSRLARAYSDRQLHGVFEPPTSPAAAKLSAARAAYAGALDESLGDAYAIDAIAAPAATWSRLPGSWSGAGLSLLGSVQPRAGAQSLPMVSATLRIEREAAPTGTLCFPVRPSSVTASSQATLPPLEFLVTHIGAVDALASGPHWLALIEPEAVPIGSEASLTFPVVNRFQPTTPRLGQQCAVPVAPANPTFSQLFQWDYTADIELQIVAQDVAKVVVHYNGSPESSTDATGRAGAPLTGQRLADLSPSAAPRAPLSGSLAAALFRFHCGFVSIVPAFDEVVAGKPSAANIVRAIADLLAPIQIGPDDGIAGAETASRNGDGLSLPLTLSLAAAPTNPGQWQLTVVAEGTSIPETLIVVPMTAAGTPQPNITTVRTNPLVIGFQPQDPAAALVVRLSLRQLDWRVVERAWTEARVVRNTALRPAMTTANRYILTTPWASFPRSAIVAVESPIQGYDIAALGTPRSAGRVISWLEMLFDLVFAVGPTRRAKFVVAYEYKLGTAPNGAGMGAMMVRVPVLATGLIVVGNDDGATTPAALACSLAQSIDTWVRTTAPSRMNARLLFDLTLMAADFADERPLLSVPNLLLSLAEIHGFG